MRLLNHRSKIIVSLLVFIVLIIVGIVHAYNMFHFPYYEDDEGTYLSQAWAVFHMERLAPYTYWYDHAPLGWLFMAVWEWLTGGYFKYGFSINSGRVFMLVLHISSCIFLFFITKKLTKSNFAGIVAIIAFSFAPLGVYFQRRVLLDNIMVFWSLLSLLFLVYYDDKLRNIILSAFCIGIAILTKENAIFFAPVLLYEVYLITKVGHKSFAIIMWGITVVFVVSLYVLYALLKGEFFPAHTLLGGNNNHVSLITTLQYQLGRKGGSVLNFQHAAFWVNMRSWFQEDPILIITGFFAVFLNIIVALKDRKARVVALLAISQVYFLMRGGEVIEFYILAVIPFFALNIGYVGYFMSKSLSRVKYLRLLSWIPSMLLITLFCIDILYYGNRIKGFSLFTSDETTPQVAAVNWINEHKKTDQFFVIDNYGYLDLHKGDLSNDKYSEYYWKVDQDPAIQESVLKDTPSNINYIAVTPQLQYDVDHSHLELTYLALRNSSFVASFQKDGWGVTIYKTNYNNSILSSTWDSYKKSFIDNGRITHTIDGGITTSEDEALALLMAAWMGDNKEFDSIYSWTKNNLRKSDGLFSWKYVLGQVNQGSASDADVDIATALLFAGKQWHNAYYSSQATQLLNAIWKYDVSYIKGKPYILASDIADNQSHAVMSLSYLSPAFYRVFSDADKRHNWSSIIDTSYIALNECTSSSREDLLQQWCTINKANLNFTSSSTAPFQVSNEPPSLSRVLWNITLDYQWNDDSRALAFIQKSNPLEVKLEKIGNDRSASSKEQQYGPSFSPIVLNAQGLGYFLVVDPIKAQNIYQGKILASYVPAIGNSYWGNKDNFYTQTWAWLGTSLYQGKAINLY